jgi:hypothetical protein
MASTQLWTWLMPMTGPKYVSTLERIITWM